MTHIQKSAHHKETSLNQLVAEVNQNFDLHQKWTTIIDSNNRAEIFFKYYCHPVAVLIDPNSHREQLGQKLLKSASSSTFFVVNLGNQSENNIFHQDYFPKELLNPAWLSNKSNIQQFASNFRQEFSQALGLNPNFRLVFLLNEKEPAETIKASTAVVQISSQNSENLEQKIEVMREKVRSMKHQEEEVKKLVEIREKEVREQYVKDQEIYATKKATLKATPTKRNGRYNDRRSPIVNGEKITRAPDSQDRARKNHEYGILKYDSGQKRNEAKRHVQIFEEQSIIQAEDLKVQIENAKKRGQTDKIEQDKFGVEDFTQEPPRIKELRIPEKSLEKTGKESPLNYKSVSSRLYEEDRLGSQDSQERQNQVSGLLVSQGQTHSTYAQAEKAEEAIRNYHPQTTGLESAKAQAEYTSQVHGIPSGAAQISYTQSQMSPRPHQTEAQQVYISPAGQVQGSAAIAETSQYRETAVSGTQVGYTQAHISPRTDYTAHISPRTEYTTAQVHASPKTEYTTTQTYISPRTEYTTAPQTHTHVSPRTEYTTPQAHISPVHQQENYTGQVQASIITYQQREGSPTREAQTGYTVSPRAEYTTTQVHVSPRTEHTTAQLQAQVSPIREERGIPQTHASPITYAHQTSQEALGSHRSDHVSPRPYQTEYAGAQVGYTQSQISPRTEYTAGLVHVSPRAEYTTAHTHLSPVHQQVDSILQQPQASARSYQSQTSQHREGSPIRESTQVGYTQAQISPRAEYIAGQVHVSPRTDYTTAQVHVSPRIEYIAGQVHISPRTEYPTTTQAQVEQALASGRSYQSQTSQHREGSPIREGAQVGHTQAQISPRTEYVTGQAYISPRAEYNTATQVQVEQALASGRSYQSQTSQHREGSPIREGTQIGYTQSQVSPRPEYTTGQVHISPRAEYTTTAQAHISPSHHIEQALASGRSYQSQTSQHREGSPIRETAIGGTQMGYTQSQVSPRTEYPTGQAHVSPRAEYTTTQAQISPSHHVEQALASGRSYQSQTSQHREGSPIRETVIGGTHIGYPQTQISPSHQQSDYILQQAQASGRSYQSQTSQHREVSPGRETGYPQSQVSPKPEYITGQVHISPRAEYAATTQAYISHSHHIDQALASGRSYQSQTSQHREGSPIREGTQIGYTQAQISPRAEYPITTAEQALASGRSYQSQTSQHREASPVREVGYTQAQVSPRAEYITTQAHTSPVYQQAQASGRSYESQISQHREASPVREAGYAQTQISPRPEYPTTTQAQVEQALASGRSYQSQTSQHREGSPIREGTQIGYTQAQISPKAEYPTTTAEQALVSGRSYQSQTSQHREASPVREVGYTQSQISPRGEYTTTAQAQISPVHQQADYILQQAQASGRSYESQTSQHREASPVRETGYAQTQVSPRGEYTTTAQAQVDQALASGRSYHSQTSQHREGSPIRESTQVGYTQAQISPRAEYPTTTAEQALASGRSYQSQTSQHREGSPIREGTQVGYTQAQISPRAEYPTTTAEQALVSGRSYQSQTSQHREASPIREVGYTQAQVSPRGEYTTTAQAQVEQALASGRSYQSQASQQHREASPVGEVGHTQSQESPARQLSGRSYESQTSQQHREASPAREDYIVQTSERSYEHREASPVREPSQVSPSHQTDDTHVSPRQAEIGQREASPAHYQADSQHKETAAVSPRTYESQTSQHRDASPVREIVEASQAQGQASPQTETVKRTEVLESRIQEEESHEVEAHHEEDKESHWVDVDENQERERIALGSDHAEEEDVHEHDEDDVDFEEQERMILESERTNRFKGEEYEEEKAGEEEESEEEEDEEEEYEVSDDGDEQIPIPSRKVIQGPEGEEIVVIQEGDQEKIEPTAVAEGQPEEVAVIGVDMGGEPLQKGTKKKKKGKKKGAKKGDKAAAGAATTKKADGAGKKPKTGSKTPATKGSAKKPAAAKTGAKKAAGAKSTSKPKTSGVKSPAGVKSPGRPGAKVTKAKSPAGKSPTKAKSPAGAKAKSPTKAKSPGKSPTKTPAKATTAKATSPKPAAKSSARKASPTKTGSPTPKKALGKAKSPGKSPKKTGEGTAKKAAKTKNPKT